MRLELISVGVFFCVASALAAEEALRLPADLHTVNDGRASIQQLYSSYERVLKQGWSVDVIAHSQPEGTSHALPIIALRSASTGPALWIVSGIHGEEPAGPNAIAAVIDDIADFGKGQAVVLIPLANPHGYLRNWRYLNSPIWIDGVEAQSVGDSSHLLPDPNVARQARSVIASSPEAGAITRYIADKIAEYPPQISIDLHEDDKISEGYIYSQGVEGAADLLAADAVRVLRENSIPLKLDGRTRFDEEIEAGIVGPVIDSSIDELMSAQEIILDGVRRPGPAAHTVLVFETPAADLPLARRIAAHAALLRRIMGRAAAGEI